MNGKRSKMMICSEWYNTDKRWRSNRTDFPRGDGSIHVYSIRVYKYTVYCIHGDDNNYAVK